MELVMNVSYHVTPHQEFEAHGQSWGPVVVAGYGKQILTTLEQLHNRQLIFVDVKPENCMLGLPGTPSAGAVYLVDFGLVARYTAFSGGHKAQATEGMGGTPLYVSLACHQGSTPSRRDDIEGLGYVLTAFLRGGHLPWEDVRSDAECLAKKKGTSLESLCEGIPGGPIMVDFLKRARDLAFEAKPDYESFHSLLDRLGAVQKSNNKAAPARRRGKAAPRGSSSNSTVSTPVSSQESTKTTSNKAPVRRASSRKSAEAESAGASAGGPAFPSSTFAPATTSTSSRARKVRDSDGKAGRGNGGGAAASSKVLEVDDEEDKEGESPRPAKRVHKARAGSRYASGGGASKIEKVGEVDDEEEESPRPPKRIHKARGVAAASTEVNVEITQEVGDGSSWLSFVTQPIKFLVQTLSGTRRGEGNGEEEEEEEREEEGRKRISRGSSSGHRGRSLVKDSEDDDDDSVVDLTGQVDDENSEDEVEVLAPKRTRATRSSRGSASSTSTATQLAAASSSSSSSTYSPHSSRLAFHVVQGPHTGETFIVSGSGAVYGGRDAGGVSLSRDRAVKPKHCSIKASGKESRSQSLKIKPLVAGEENVIVVNGSKVGKSGRQLFVGDVVQIGESRMTIQKC